MQYRLAFHWKYSLTNNMLVMNAAMNKALVEVKVVLFPCVRLADSIPEVSSNISAVYIFLEPPLIYWYNVITDTHCCVRHADHPFCALCGGKGFYNEFYWCLSIQKILLLDSWSSQNDLTELLTNV